MSPAEQNPNSDRANAGQPIETVYTTVESQQDRTDWLTVVSNLRQINRQLLEEIARLEEALASAKQTLHTHKEENQNHEITILQQQDELRIAHDRVGALFQQLETSHQIGQRQQTLIETLSQQLEITQAIVPQIEAEHEELSQKYQQQSQQLIKTEKVALELNRRLKLLQANTHREATDPNATVTDAASSESNPDLNISDDRSAAAELDSDANSATTNESGLADPISAAEMTTAAIDPAPPLAPLPVSELEIPARTTSEPAPAAKTILSPPPSSATTNWREAIASSNNRYHLTPDLDPDFTRRSTETVHKESTAIEDPTTKSGSNWPAPTVNLDALQSSNPDRPVAKTVTIDLPKFPKKQED